MVLTSLADSGTLRNGLYATIMLRSVVMEPSCLGKLFNKLYERSRVSKALSCPMDSTRFSSLFLLTTSSVNYSEF